MKITRNYSSSEAYDLMCQGDIFTDGSLYYYCGTTKRKDGISIRIIQVYDSLIKKVDPIALVYPKKWIGETKGILWKAYMDSSAALEAMLAGHAVMDSNANLYFRDVITNPATGSSWSRIIALDEDGDPQVTLTEEGFRDEYRDDNYFIIYNEEIEGMRK